jgi:hypothetical protein
MSYTKLRTDIEPYEVTQSNFNGAPFTFEKGTQIAGGSFTGDFNPGWRDQIKGGGGATTNANGSLATITPGFLDLISVVQATSADHTLYSDTIVGIPSLQGFRTQESPPSDSIVTDVTNRAIRKFLDSADSARSSIEFGQDLGEWKETIHGLIHPVQTLRDYVFHHLAKVTKLTQMITVGKKTYLLRGVKHKASLSKMVADTWLEFKFGWNPLAADIGKAYADFTNNRNHQAVHPVYGSGHVPFITYDGPVTGIQGSIGQANCRLRVTGVYQVRLKGAIRTGAVNGRLGAAQLLQLDLPHFAPTIWDLLPYSWIVDYFTNVGDIIRSLCFNTSDLVWGNKTIRTEYTYEYFWSYSAQPPNQFFTMVFAGGATVNPVGLVVNFTRNAIYPGDLIPRVQISLPLGSLKPWENLTALFVGRQKEITRLASNLR